MRPDCMEEVSLIRYVLDRSQLFGRRRDERDGPGDAPEADLQPTNYWAGAGRRPWIVLVSTPWSGTAGLWAFARSGTGITLRGWQGWPADIAVIPTGVWMHSR
jgi:hypothetical protein